MAKVAVEVAAKKAACSRVDVRTAVVVVVRVAVEKLEDLAAKMVAGLAANLACQMATNLWRRRRGNAPLDRQADGFC